MIMQVAIKQNVNSVTDLLHAATNTLALTMLGKLVKAAVPQTHQQSHQDQQDHREGYCHSLPDQALQCFHFCLDSDWDSV